MSSPRTPRPLTPRQVDQNRAFLRRLAASGNVIEAARAVGAHRTTFLRRRARHPGFAAQWDAALALAQARDGKSPNGKSPAGPGAKGEPQRVRLADGRYQLRRPHPRGLDHAGEQRFLAALSATANIRFAAAAAGFSHSTFYARRKASPAFAREMRLALETGYDRIEMALLASFDPGSHQDDAWRRNDLPDIPSMTPAQGLQLLYLHQKQARLEAEPDHIKRRRGESREAHSTRLAAMYEAREQRQREAWQIADAERRARGEPDPFGRPDPPLPPLDQVTGWSKARGNPPHDPDRAMFGGHRGRYPKR